MRMQIERIHTLSDSRLQSYIGLTDSQLRNRLEPEKGIFIAESEKVIKRALAAGYQPLSFLMEERWLEGLQGAIEEAEVVRRATGASEFRQGDDEFDAPIFIAGRELLAELVGYEVTRGALAAFRRPALPSIEEICGDAKNIAVLEDITNTVNVGAIFRNAAALDIDAVLLTPGCCDPLYRRALRVSMGNALKVPWTYIGTEVDGKGAHGNVRRAGGWCETGISKLRAMGFETIALALSEKALTLDDPALKLIERKAIIVGTEGDGLSERTIGECDHVARIPMSHDVDSLNVATAAAIAFWELGR